MITEERYNQINGMTEAQLNDLTDDEYHEFELMRYSKQTDNNAALADLMSAVEGRLQGYEDELWRTGFENLDKKLDGGFMGEQLIFLGAISSLGKTSFALQIATQIAEQGRDVLIFSLEMSKNELNAKTISRYTHELTEKDIYRRTLRLTTRDILSGNVGGVAFGGKGINNQGEVFIEAFNAAKKIAANTRIYVGENNVDVDLVRDVVENHIGVTKNRPFVILDYLQILQPSPLAKTADKRILTDYDVTRLKVLSRDFHIPVFVISAFNRTSYLDPVNYGSFSESSRIEYSSDILLAMQYQGMDYIKKWITTEKGKRKVFENKIEHEARVRELLNKMSINGAAGECLPIELKILKNRNGSKGSLFFEFLPAYNYYSVSEQRPINDEGADYGDGYETFKPVSKDEDVPFEDEYESLGTV